jgi:hypothetical protein
MNKISSNLEYEFRNKSIVTNNLIQQVLRNLEASDKKRVINISKKRHEKNIV